MNKLEVIQTLCEQNGLSNAESKKIVSIGGGPQNLDNVLSSKSA